MGSNRKLYPENHWIRSEDPEQALQTYLEQQSLAYSRIKNEFVQELLGDLRGKRVLDYGCGGGLFTVHAAKNGAARVFAVDAEESAVETARYFAMREGVESMCTFMVRDEFPTFPNGERFDVILMKDVVEHVLDDGALFDKAALAVNPGGQLVVSTQNALSINYLIQGTYHRWWLGNKNWYGWDETHVRFYTSMTLARKLKKAGFSCTDWRSVYIIPYKLPAVPGSGKKFFRIDVLSGIDRILGGIFPYNRLGWNIIVKAEASPLVKERTPNLQTVPGALPVSLATLCKEM